MTQFMQNIGKYASIALGGVLATLALFITMQRLITTEFVPPSLEPGLRIADITAPELEPDIVRKQPRPEKLEEPDELPPLVVTDKYTIDGNNTAFAFKKPVIAELPGAGDGLGINNAEAIALVQVQPAYPPRALQRGIEGYIVVEFDVDEAGLVINPRVLYAEPEGYFDAAALKALERYRYQPKLVNGKEVKMYGVQQKLTFTLE